MDKVDKIMTGFTRVFARKVENQASVESPCLAQPAEAVPPSSTVAGEVERQLASALPAFRTILRKELKQSRIDSKKDEESSLLEQVHSLQIEYRQLEETNSALQDENQELQRRLADVGTGQNRQPGFPRLSEEVRSLQLENRKLGEESKELRDERNDMREEIKNLKRRVVELEDVVKMPLNQPLGHPKRNRSSDDHDGGQESTSEKPEWALGTKTSKQKSKAVEAGQDKSKSDDVLDSGTACGNNAVNHGAKIVPPRHSEHKIELFGADFQQFDHTYGYLIKKHKMIQAARCRKCKALLSETLADKKNVAYVCAHVAKVYKAYPDQGLPCQHIYCGTCFHKEIEKGSSGGRGRRAATHQTSGET